MADSHAYMIALGSNRASRHGRRPAAMLRSAINALREAGLSIEAVAPIVASAPIGSARRTFANSAAIVGTNLPPPDLLPLLKSIERQLGRRRGQRWGDRCIDIDIILWSGGLWQDRTLAIPHPRWRERIFVVRPLMSLAPDWRDPESGRSIRQICFRRLASRPKVLAKKLTNFKPFSTSQQIAR